MEGLSAEKAARNMGFLLLMKAEGFFFFMDFGSAIASVAESIPLLYSNKRENFKISGNVFCLLKVKDVPPFFGTLAEGYTVPIKELRQLSTT